MLKIINGHIRSELNKNAVREINIPVILVVDEEGDLVDYYDEGRIRICIYEEVKRNYPEHFKK